MLVGLHIVSLDDAILRIQHLYSNPWQSFQTGMMGLLFLIIGLLFSKMLVKSGRDSEAVIFQSDLGPIVVTIQAIDDVVRKILKRFYLIKESKIKTVVDGRQVEVRLRLSLWSGGNIPELLEEIQGLVQARVQKLLGPEVKVEVNCDVQHIEDHTVDDTILSEEKNHSNNL